MDKRNKFWRRQQMARVFKARMILYAAYGHCIIREDGSYYEHPRWFELAKEKWAQVYKTTGTPCSCWMCRGFEYDRKEYKKETRRIIRDELNDKELNLCINCIGSVFMWHIDQKVTWIFSESNV